jgi:hypothetical protein
VPTEAATAYRAALDLAPEATRADLERRLTTLEAGERP